MDIIKLIWKNALFLAKANGLMMRVDFIPLCIIDIFSLLDAYFINVKRHHYFSCFFFVFFYLHSFTLVDFFWLFGSTSNPVCKCMYACGCMTFICPIWDSQNQLLAVRRRRYKNISACNKKEVKLILGDPGTYRLSSTDLKAFNKCAIFFSFCCNHM